MILKNKDKNALLIAAVNQMRELLIAGTQIKVSEFHAPGEVLYLMNDVINLQQEFQSGEILLVTESETYTERAILLDQRGQAFFIGSDIVVFCCDTEIIETLVFDETIFNRLRRFFGLQLKAEIVYEYYTWFEKI